MIPSDAFVFIEEKASFYFRKVERRNRVSLHNFYHTEKVERRAGKPLLKKCHNEFFERRLFN
jgi:hypothetical protein